MAKSKQLKPNSADPTEVTVTYDLFDLPTAFHKAGLAGLLLLIQSLRQRNILTEFQSRYALAPTSATVTFTEPILQLLMDDLYDASIIEVAVKSKWQGATVKREEVVEETASSTTSYSRLAAFFAIIIQTRTGFG
jgi:CRISPR-associated protein Cmx8